jgi:hypothetical protein
VVAIPASALARKAPPAPDPWKDYRYPQMGYAVALPSPPREQRRPPPPGFGDNPIVAMISDAETQAFGVIFIDRGAAPADVNKTLEDAVTAETTGCTVLQDTPLKIGAATGRDVLARDGHRTIRSRLLLAGGRLYQVMAFSSGGEPAPDAERFINSFRLIEP